MSVWSWEDQTLPALGTLTHGWRSGWGDRKGTLQQDPEENLNPGFENHWRRGAASGEAWSIQSASRSVFKMRTLLSGITDITGGPWDSHHSDSKRVCDLQHLFQDKALMTSWLPVYQWGDCRLSLVEWPQGLKFSLHLLCKALGHVRTTLSTPHLGRKQRSGLGKQGTETGHAGRSLWVPSAQWESNTICPGSHQAGSQRLVICQPLQLPQIFITSASYWLPYFIKATDILHHCQKEKEIQPWTHYPRVLVKIVALHATLHVPVCELLEGWVLLLSAFPVSAIAWHRRGIPWEGTSLWVIPHWARIKDSSQLPTELTSGLTGGKKNSPSAKSRLFNPLGNFTKGSQAPHLEPTRWMRRRWKAHRALSGRVWTPGQQQSHGVLSKRRSEASATTQTPKLRKMWC